MPTFNSAPGRTDAPRPLVALIGAIVLVLAVASTTSAEEPLRLEGPITDTTGVLDARDDEISAALGEVRAEAGVDLWVLFVNTTGPLSASAYEDQVVELNSLGGNDALLLVALEDRTARTWVSEEVDTISQEELTQAHAERLEPRLREGDYAGAVIGLANGLSEAAVGTPGGGAGGGSLLPLLGIGLLLLGIFLVARWVFAWRARRAEEEERDRRTGELAKRANQLLLEADDAVKDSEQELGFAEAQFTPQEVQPFRDAARQARAETAAAFAVRQRLDDATPEDPDTREKLLNEVVTRAQRALDLLAAQRERVAEIRALERSAPELLAKMPARLEALAATVPEARARLERLSRFAETTTAPVAGNLVEVEKRLAAARRGVDDGTAALSAQDQQAAGRSARLAHEALAEAEQLLAAIEHLEGGVTATAARLEDELREAERSVEAARAALRQVEPTPPEQAQRISRAEESLARARALEAQARPDPLAAERLAGEADKLSDDVLAAAHAEAERRARAVATARSALLTAESAYTQALDYVTSRRSAIGRRARTRLAEAERHLAQARVVVDSDPLAAAQAARRAESLSREALSYGQADLQHFDPFGGRSGGGSDIPMIILGGIIGGMLQGGGGRSGAGWGGTPWGRSGGGMFGGGRGGGFNIPRMPGAGRSTGGRW